MSKYLDKAGLERVWSKLKAMLNNKADLDLSNTSGNALNNIGGALVYTSASTVSTFKRVFIAPNGDDANTGANASVPMLTIKNAIKKYANAYKYIDVTMADGEYTEDVDTIANDCCNVGIRSTSENKDAVILNTSKTLDTHLNLLRIYNITINMNQSNVRPISIDAGTVFMYNVRINVPDGSSSSCVNVYNGCSLFATNCVFNSSTTGNSSAVYSNQGMIARLINCTSERSVACGVYAINGAVIEYTPTITAKTESKTSNYGRCIKIQ